MPCIVASAPLNFNMSINFVEQAVNEIDYDGAAIEDMIEDHDYFGSGDNDWADCNLGEEEILSFLTPPDVDLWTDYKSQSNPSLFTIDDAKKQNWDLAKKEINHLKERIGPAYNIDTTNLTAENINHKIVMETLGYKSAIGQFLSKELGLAEKTYLAFICTFCVQSSYRLSPTELFTKHSLLKDKVPMKREEYFKLWADLSTKKKLSPNTIRTSRCDTPLWQSLEVIVNAELKKIAISGREGRVAISLDDDKIWFSSKHSTMSDLFDLKYATHVQANRKGIIAHSAISAGIMMPLQISFERTKDGAASSLMRMLTSLFGANGVADLQNVDVHSDRGYMIREVSDFLLENGAHFVGTVKRLAKCWPFTYNQEIKNPETDKRTLLSVKGAPTLFLKYTKPAGAHKTLFASAFRNGSQSVATAVSSIHRGHQWEGIAIKPSEHARWKQDDSALVKEFFQKAIINKGRFEEDECDRELLDQLLDNEIVPFTLRQGTADWHWLRKFSLTSSQAHQAFLKAIPVHSDNDKWISVAEYLYGAEWIGHLHLNDAQETSAEQQDTASADVVVPQTFLEFISAEEQVIPTNENVFIVAAAWLKSKIDPEVISESESAAKIEWRDLRFPDSESDREVKTTITRILIQFNPYELDRKENLSQADILKWMISPNGEREVMFYTNISLKEIMKRKKLKVQPGSGTLNMKRMIKAIAGTDMAGIVDDVPLVNNVVTLSAEQATMKAVLEKSFLPHQKGNKREHCSLGHRLELPILRKFTEIIPDVREYRGIEVKTAYTAGLAAKKGELHAKDSIDFVLSVNDPKYNGGARTLWGFEAKGRVTIRTATTEEEHNHDFRATNPHLRIEDSEVFQCVAKPAERFQVLQHAYVYNFKTVVLAICDSQSELICSYIIDFTDELKEAFGNVLLDLKELVLEWAYPEHLSLRNDVLSIPAEIANVAKSIPAINGFDTLQGTINLWHTLRKESMPFPSLKRIIPSICAYWNSVKGGSDTTTKLMDDCILQLPRPYCNTETVAITRLIQMMLVTNHRLFQCTTNKYNLDNYPSLAHWRDAATHRFTYHKSLVFVSASFVKELEVLTDMNPAAFAHIPRPGLTEPDKEAVDGIVPVQIRYAPTLSRKTPMKINKHIKDGSGDTEVLTMAFRCVGIPAQMYDKGADHKCGICKSNTSWYCAGCKRWLCLTKIKRNVKDLYYHDVRGREIMFVKSCFHIAHDGAWDRYFNERNQVLFDESSRSDDSSSNSSINSFP